MHQGKAVRGQHRRLGGEIVVVKAVGNQMHRRGGAGLEVGAHRLGHGYYGAGGVEHFLLHGTVPRGRPRQQAHVLEVMHLRPRIAEIRYPAYAGNARELHADKVHGVRRAGGDNRIDGVLLQILLEEPDRRIHPAHAGVGNEQVAPQANHQALLERLLLLVEGIYAGALVGSPEELVIYGVGLADMAP